MNLDNRDADALGGLAQLIRSFHVSADYEHTLFAVAREHDGMVLHALGDGEVWWGSCTDREQSDELAELIESVRYSEESDITASIYAASKAGPQARMIDGVQSAAADDLIGSMARMLADSLSCRSVAVIARDVGKDPAWLAARWRAGRVHYFEGPPDLLTRELVALNGLADQGWKQGLRSKPPLQMAELGSGGYTLELPAEIAEMMQAQLGRFRDKFGREPGPNDPIFFDPDAAEPQPIPEEEIDKIMALMSEHGFGEQELLQAQATAEEEGRLVRHGKVGRNDPCPCRSGKKFKRCCGA